MRILRLILCLSLVGSLPLTASEYQAPERVQDLKYGAVLYEYYQGHAFEALTALNVAKQRGGIKGHGDHPALVEGGLMLSYGMTRDAKAVFESLLDDSSSEKVPHSSRNQAWYYLGKVFYLEQDYVAARESLEKVDSVLLQQSKPDLFQEWLYLKGQISQHLDQNVNGVAEQIKQLPEGNLWRAYLSYNQVVMLSDKQPELAVSQLQSLSESLKTTLVRYDGDFSERRALREQCLLTLGQLHLQLAQYDQAIEALKQIRLDSVFSDQALFAYAIAASNLEQFGLALQALNTLRDRALFTPWLQQVPYALAYLYEQLQQPELALQAYRSAAGHYQQLAERLEHEQQTLTEQKIIAALKLDDSRQLQLGAESLVNDAYGRLAIEPGDFNLAVLLSSEAFQLLLRDLHELYKLKSSLSRWEGQLDSFSLMMNTREQLRRQRIDETVAAIEAQQADRWIDQQRAWMTDIAQAKSEQNAAFFASEQQLEFKAQIQSVMATLKAFPEGDEKAEYRKKIKRIRAYYDWWIADQYGVNLWQAEKQLIGLTRAVDQFKSQRTKLKQQMQSNQQNARLASRIREGRARLQTLNAELDQGLNNARDELLRQVRVDLEVQSAETQQYLIASRQAQARLSDLLYRQAKVAPDRAHNTETETETETHAEGDQ